MVTNTLGKVLGHMDNQLYKLFLSYSSSIRMFFHHIIFSFMQKYNLLKVLDVTDSILWEGVVVRSTMYARKDI